MNAVGSPAEYRHTVLIFYSSWRSLEEWGGGVGGLREPPEERLTGNAGYVQLTRSQSAARVARSCVWFSPFSAKV